MLSLSCLSPCSAHRIINGQCPYTQKVSPLKPQYFPAWGCSLVFALIRPNISRVTPRSHWNEGQELVDNWPNFFHPEWDHFEICSQSPGGLRGSPALPAQGGPCPSHALCWLPVSLIHSILCFSEHLANKQLAPKSWFQGLPLWETNLR